MTSEYIAMDRSNYDLMQDAWLQQRAPPLPISPLRTFSGYKEALNFIKPIATSTAVNVLDFYEGDPHILNNVSIFFAFVIYFFFPLK